MTSFRPYGMSAIVCAGLLRALAFGLARRDSIYAVDDYITMSYPNIFFVIALVSISAQWSCRLMQRGF
ncbi:MAG: hypothetical protein U9N60_12075 [Thermodesulfobacteriota bacterium]|nr:hypothetical protein [Thermodesulfobacteriota bacterium]